MQSSVPGIYRNGIVELSEVPPPVGENAPVLVSFFTNGEEQKAQNGEPAKAEKTALSLPPADVSRQLEYDWVRAHREEYAGQYVALDGARLVSHADTLREVYRLAHAEGTPHPFIVRIEAKDELPFGGW